MKKIGITGGIGSGKTTVCEIFKMLGIAVFHADDEGRKLQNSDIRIKNFLINRFGIEIYSRDGLLDRKKMAGIVFNDLKSLADLNAIIHPAVRQSFLKWADLHREESYVLYESAILLESGNASDFDRTILVVADERIRIGRIMNRDHTSADLIKQRIKNQFSDIQKLKLADYVIENNCKELLIPQIIDLDKRIKADLKIE